MNKVKKTLLVGCGGSGIKTILNFNRLMAGDAQCRNRLWEDVSYLIVDTDEEDIKAFEEEVNVALRSSDADRAIAPAMKTVHITRNLTILNDVIQKKVAKVKDPEKRENFKKNWWFSPDGEPFRAIHSRDIGVGAAQCPAISYMAVWNYLPTLEKNINALLDDISARSSSEDWSLSGLRVFLIAGTSGGTGRGTWNLVSFKLRECIQRRLPNAEIDIPAIFIDSSCYRDNTKNDDLKTFSKTVNSLTALSELSAWLALRDEIAYSYSLPPLSSPRATNGTEKATDVIRVDASGGDPYQQSPLRYAYLVFGNNSTVKLSCGGGLNEYCEMAGSALFALVAQAPQFRSDDSNSLPKYCSFAAATAEVETVKLRKYFESALRRSKIKALYGKMSEDESEAYGESLLKSFGFLQAVPVDENFLDANCGSGELPKGAQILSRLFSKLLNGPLRGGLVLDSSQLVGKDGFFAEQDLGSVSDQISTKFRLIGEILTSQQVGNVIDGILREDALALDSSLKSKGVSIPVPREFSDPLTKLLWLQAVSAFQDGGRPSVMRMAECLSFLSGMAEKSEANLGELSQEDGLEVLLELCDKYAHNQGLCFWAAVFDEEEQRTIAEQFVLYAKFAIYRCVREVLAVKFRAAKDRLDIWSKALKGVLEALDEASSYYYREGNEACTGKRDVSAFRNLFIDKSPESIDSSIPKAKVSSSVVRRVFKPIMSRQEVSDLLCTKEMSVCDEGALARSVAKSIGMAFAEGEDFGRDDVDTLCDGFVHLLGREVRVRQENLYAEFTLEKVLARNLKGWNELLDIKSLSGELDELQDRLRAFLGVSQHVEGDYAMDGATPRLKLSKIKQRLPESLARNCCPWIVFDNDDDNLGTTNLQTTLLIPYDMLPAERENCEKAVTHDGEKDVNVIDKSLPKGARIPQDCMIAYSSIFVPVEGVEGHPLDHVVSLKQDMADPRVMEALVRAESSEALGYFSHDAQTGKYVERFRGLGFVSPVFLNEPALSDRRWKPWQRAVEAYAEKKEKEGRALEAVVYALSGVDLKSNSTALATFRRAHWEFPLLVRKTAKSNKFKFMREAYRLDNGAVAFVADPKWAKGTVLDVSGIAELVDYLNGKGLKDENGAVISGSKAAGAAVLKQLVSEMDIFKSEIVGKFAVSAWKKIADERYAWIKAVANRKERMPVRDRETWLKLVAVADANRVR